MMFSAADWEDGDTAGQETLMSGLFSPIESNPTPMKSTTKRKRNRAKKTGQVRGIPETSTQSPETGPSEDDHLANARRKKKRKHDSDGSEQQGGTAMAEVTKSGTTQDGAAKKKRPIQTAGKNKIQQRESGHIVAEQSPDSSSVPKHISVSGKQPKTRKDKSKAAPQVATLKPQRGAVRDKPSHKKTVVQATPAKAAASKQHLPYQDRSERLLQQQGKKSKMSLQEKLRSKLDSGRFRYVNEQLYTSTSREAVTLFKKEPKLFDIYHDGFASQVSKWPVNPVDGILAWLSKKPSSWTVADLGCGEAKIGRTAQQTVHSFDLVAANDYVTACDMAHVPLDNNSVDVVVFCLSLMGTNLNDFVKEARRILRSRGVLKVAEVKSRIEDIEEFCEAICEHGFQVKEQDEGNKMFVDIEFHKLDAQSASHSSYLSLKPCLYKRR
eukprot:scpid43478/ scgid27528/ Ribosomal RNA-processing protein 8